MNNINSTGELQKDKEKQLTDLLAMLPDVVLIHKNGIIMYANQAAFFVTEYTASELIGSHILNYVTEEYKDMAVQKLKQRLAGEEIADYECDFIRKSGRISTAIVRSILTSFYEELTFVTILINITDRKIAEKIIAQSKETYRLLLHYTSDPLFSINPDETYRFVNEAFALRVNLTPKEIIGKTPYDIYPRDKAEKYLKVIRNVFLTGEKGEHEAPFVMKSGEVRYYFTKVAPIKDKSGKVIWVTCIATDITERRKNEEQLVLLNNQLQKTNSEKDKFFSILSHDLRSPFQGFIGLTNLLAEDASGFTLEELTSAVKAMSSSANNLYKLLMNLLEWAQMQNGTVSFNPTPLVLSNLVSQNIDHISSQCQQKAIKITCDVPENLTVLADKQMLNSIFRNLLTNALKFSNRGEKIIVNAKEIENNFIEISVADTGVGMSESLTQKLFKIEEKVGRIGTEEEASTGLGLLLCKEFVIKNGGNIWVTSREHKGSTFYFTLKTALKNN